MALSENLSRDMESLLSDVPFQVAENSVRANQQRRDLFALVDGTRGAAITMSGVFTKANAEALAKRLSKLVGQSEPPSRLSDPNTIANLFADCNIEFHDHTLAVDEIFRNAAVRVDREFSEVGGFSLSGSHEERLLRSEAAKLLSSTNGDDIEVETFVVSRLSSIADRALALPNTANSTVRVADASISSDRSSVASVTSRVSARDTKESGRGGR